MSSYTVKPGDTFSSISKATSGTGAASELIQRANPGSGGTPVAGTTIFIPSAPTIRAPVSTSRGAVVITVDGDVFDGWTDLTFTRNMDTFGSFQFASVWEPSNQRLRDALRPFSFRTVSAFEGDRLLFTGTILTATPRQSSASRTVSVSGYALPAVLNDCTMPISALPLETDDATLQAVAEQLCAPFGVPVQFDTDPGPTFPREAIKADENVFGYLVKLAKQRNVLITDTPDGTCKFHTEAPAGQPRATIREGEPGITSIVPQFNPQEYYSHISGQSLTGFGAPDAAAGDSYTVKNERLTGSLRPHTFTPPDTAGADVKTAAEAKAGRMFANAVAYSVEVPSWLDPNGAQWEPNTTVLLEAPGAMIYREYEFLVRSVQYALSSDQRRATLTLTLPGAFNGRIPESMPWAD